MSKFPTTPLFELCLEGIDAVHLAAAAGVPRIELCAGLAEGGLTPSQATVAAARAAYPGSLMVMIRPRGGDFLYTPAEFELMLHDTEICRSLGADGIVFGCLHPDGHPNQDRCRTLVKAAGPLQTVFHRAFDVCRNPFASLEALIGLGVTRVLTSGQAATVPEGIDLIRQLVELAAGRIEILPGCGIKPDNVVKVLEISKANQFHATAFATQRSGMIHRNERVYMGVPGLAEYQRRVTSAAEIERFRNAL